MACADFGKRWSQRVVVLVLLIVPVAVPAQEVARELARELAQERARDPIDLNRATVAELQTLPSIGPVLAQRIVEHRRKHGSFRRPAEILAIRGVSARKYRQIAHLLTTR